MIINNNLGDVFQFITAAYHQVGDHSLHDHQYRFNSTRFACLYLIHYLHHKSKYQKQLAPINNQLIIHEKKILEAFGHDITFEILDKEYVIIKKNTTDIQKLLLDVMPPESDGFKSLVKLFPDLVKYQPG